jgi:1-acyl-sn-glycerol-3-phosphate acyltransferase
MDPIVLAVHLKRPLFFLARGESFNSKLVSFFFRGLHMIPIYRPEISPDLTYKNEEVFQKCFDHLKRGKTILIFPEGISKTKRNLQKLKTGTARIVLGAEAQNDFKLSVKIVPVGINYSNPHHFRSDVFVNFGLPKGVLEYRDLYEDNQMEGVIKLTQDIELELIKLLIIVKDEKLDKLITQIEYLYRSKLRDESLEVDKAIQDFYISKEIVNAVEYIQKEFADKAMKFELKISNYFNILKRLKLRDTLIRTRSIRIEIWTNILFFILGFPIFIYGYFTNIIPFTISKYLSKKILVRKDFIGSMKLAFGMFVFLFFYLSIIIILAMLTHWYWAVLFAMSLYPAGVFTINYIKRYYYFRGNIRYINLFIKKSNLIANLKLIRKELIEELEESRELYINTIK